MRRLVAVGFVAACGGSLAASSAPDAEAPDAEAPRVVTMSVVVDPFSVTLYTDGADLSCLPPAGDYTFPATGSCADSSDVIDCASGPPSSCLIDMAVSVAGKVFANAPVQAGRPTAIQFNHQPGATLVVAGCGAVAQIPLGDTIGPSTTATLIVQLQSIKVMWATDHVADSIFVQLEDAVAESACHTSANPFIFQPGAGLSLNNSFLTVEAFATPTQLVTGLGPATVWSAGIGVFPLQE